ncbi:MAG: cysteine desulfurase family protein [Ethanoligenens sp.]
MIYLDYAAHTPADETVLQTFCDTTRDYTANSSSPHPLGLTAKERLDAATREIAALVDAKETEIIYTSGASESNNLAIKGAAHQYRMRGKHILSTWLEHSSVTGALAALAQEGYEIEYLNLTPEGQVDLADLRAKLRKDTVLVSVCMVDSEIGLRQPVAEIKEILMDYPHCVFHVDAAQAAGKLPVSLKDADLITFAPHKFYGLIGSGVLLRRESVLLTPLIDGGISTTPFRSGTPALPHITATATALSLALRERETRMTYVESLNRRLRQALAADPDIRINSTTCAVPYILNISLPGVRAEKMQQALAEQDICLSTKSACCAPGTVSRPVFALTKDKKAALSTLRISLSHLTTAEEIEAFLAAFGKCKRTLYQ